MIYSVPNVSEGRDLAVLERFAEAVRPHARVLHVDPGWDANRSVFTLAPHRDAGPEGLVEANLALARACLAELDLRIHRGVHVRMGVVDVIPFVPLHGEQEEAKALAHALSTRIADELGLPVYRYGAGSRDLRSVRREGFEVLPETMASIPPEYGPAVPHATGGAVAVGVRDVLVAFNVCLATEDVALARRVAKAVRASSGGLPGVLAIGWHTPHLGCAQVSMNLTDWKRTPPHVVVDAIAELAPVAGAELVGMIPLAALEAAARHYGTDLEGAVRRMGLDRVKPFSLAEQVLDYRL